MSILAEKSLDRPVMNKYETLFHRHPSNPILTGKDWPYSMNSVFNAGATLLPDGSTLLLCRVEDRRGISHLCVARSVNGVDGWQIDREPTLLPDVFFFSSRRRHTRWNCDWSSDVCSSDLAVRRRRPTRSTWWRPRCRPR